MSGRREGGNAFDRPEILNEMLALRKEGWSYAAIGIKYDRDHSTIVYWCQKSGITPIGLRKIKRVYRPRAYKNVVLPESLMVEERINEGKSYAEYLEEDRKRKYGKLYPFIPKHRTNVNFFVKPVDTE